VNISDMTVGMWCWRRPQYLRRTLASWARVDGVHDLRQITIALEPSDRKADMLAVIDHARDEYGLPLTVRHNPEQLSVSVNPVVSGSRILNQDWGAKFLIAMDEDMLLSDDLLRYFEWAATRFEDDPAVFGVCAHTAENTTADADPALVQLLPRFRTWVWGTWRDRWFDIAVPTWDRDYSSGNPSGYDWNLDLRVVPERGLRCVFPLASRSQDTGKYEGVHAQPADFDRFQDPSFRAERGKVEYRLVEAP
jgi:hypothetical protein